MALFVLLVLFLSLSCYGVAGRNKIQPTNVNEFDCVDIYKQPAFDHPLLKNHKIQMNPSFSSKLMKNRELSFVKYSNFQLPSEGCPPGMVPIQKSRINGQTNMKSPSKLHLENIHPLTDTQPGNHFSTYESLLAPTYHGASALIDIQNPHVEMNQISMAQIWLQNGPTAELNNIQVGWGVHPRIYGDNRTRLTAMWTADNFQKTGCYNVICPGFVQVNPTLYPGLPFHDVSVPGGQQYATNPIVMQDKATGNWWLTLSTKQAGIIKLGYWPKEIFTHLSKGATYLRFGGWTYSSPNGLSPPMGSGIFPTTETKKSSWFAQLKIAVQFDDLVNLGSLSIRMLEFTDNDCYDLKYWGDQYGVLQDCFTYGGPGGQCGI